MSGDWEVVVRDDDTGTRDIFRPCFAKYGCQCSKVRKFQAIWQNGNFWCVAFYYNRMGDALFWCAREYPCVTDDVIQIICDLSNIFDVVTRNSDLPLIGAPGGAPISNFPLPLKFNGPPGASIA